MRAPRVVVECWRVRAGVGVPGVPGDRTRAFTAAYAADGAWGELFAKATGFLGTELYRDAAPGRPVPDDRPLAGRARLAGVPQRIRVAYEALDAQLEGLAAAERSLFEGSS